MLIYAIQKELARETNTFPTINNAKKNLGLFYILIDNFSHTAQSSSISTANTEQLNKQTIQPVIGFNKYISTVCEYVQFTSLIRTEINATVKLFRL